MGMGGNDMAEMTAKVYLAKVRIEAVKNYKF